jgi:hypothetical protein
MTYQAAACAVFSFRIPSRAIIGKNLGDKDESIAGTPVGPTAG